jgi:hypothetical protein
VIVVGAEGDPEYGAQFNQWADRWEQAAQRGDARLIRIGDQDSDSAADRDRLKETLAALPAKSTAALWLVLIGHGTFDGRLAKINLRGPDVSAKELAGWLEPFERPLAVINCASASGPFVNRLSAAGRVVVTATKSGYEHHYARFGNYLSAAIADQGDDLDKDGQTSLLEAYLAASARVAEFYAQQGRLATEHSLLDDNGDGLGTPASWFRGVRAVRKAEDNALPDGARAHQLHLIRGELEQNMPPDVRSRRDQLELAVIQLREKKPELDEGEYYRELETLILELARLYERLDRPREANQPSQNSRGG